MIETLALVDRERIDRQTAERLFDLRKTAAFQLLRHMGAEPVGHSLAISRTLLMARLREVQEHPQWRWERERRIRIRDRIDSLRVNNRKSLVPIDVALRQATETAEIDGLPATIQLSRGLLAIHCSDMQDLLGQLVLLAQAADRNYEDLRKQIEVAIDFQRARLPRHDRKIPLSSHDGREYFTQQCPKKLTALDMTPCRNEGDLRSTASAPIEPTAAGPRSRPGRTPNW